MNLIWIMPAEGAHVILFAIRFFSRRERPFFISQSFQKTQGVIILCNMQIAKLPK